jgi:hypothetical protein
VPGFAGMQCRDCKCVNRACLCMRAREPTACMIRRMHAREYVDVGAGVGVDVGEGVGVGVVHTDDSELHVGYAACSVDPQLSYIPRLMQSARPTLSNAEAEEVTRNTFHDAMFELNAAAELNIPSMLLTFAVFHAAMFWLNTLAE